MSKQTIKKSDISSYQTLIYVFECPVCLNENHTDIDPEDQLNYICDSCGLDIEIINE